MVCFRPYRLFTGSKGQKQEREYKNNLEEVMHNERLNGRSHPHSEERPTIKH